MIVATVLKLAVWLPLTLGQVDPDSVTIDYPVRCLCSADAVIRYVRIWVAEA